MEGGGQAPLISLTNDADAAARLAADRFVKIARAGVEARGRFSVALAGGSTPQLAYRLLAAEPYRSLVPWPAAHVFFGDERCVPPDHPESNYRAAREALLMHVPISAQNVRRMKGEREPREAAREYEAELRDFFGAGAAWPRFDLVLLGMGDDGHTASLFPGTAALDETRAWAAANRVGKLNAHRVTLTAPAINAAAHVIFLVTGAGKAETLADVLRPTHPTRATSPARLIRPGDGTLEWIVDRDAASRL